MIYKDISHHKKGTFLALTLCLFTLLAQAENWRKVAPRRQATLITTIAKATRAVKQMGASFTQTTDVSYMEEPVSASGIMDYDNRGNLKWEYVKPYRYGFTLNDHSVTLLSDGQRRTIDLQSSRNFQRIAQLVKGSLTGQSLTGSRDFKITMYENASTWRAELIPVKSQLKRYMQRVTLYFDRRRKVVDKVVMHQNNNDRITVMLYDIKFSR